MRPSPLPAALVLALAALMLPAAPVFAQTEKAVLLRGPRPGRGIGLFGPNALSYERAEYSYRTGTVRVYYITDYQPPPRDWVRELCGRIQLIRPPSGYLFLGDEGLGEEIYLYSSDDGWSLLFLFTQWGGEHCPFIQGFLGGFRYFLRMKVSPFPAAVELP